jgi:hypothetical protein
MNAWSLQKGGGEDEGHANFTQVFFVVLMSTTIVFVTSPFKVHG